MYVTTENLKIEVLKNHQRGTNVESVITQRCEIDL